MYNGDLEQSNDEYALAARGMRRPQVTLLRTGEVVYRFASSKGVRSGKAVPSEKWARGPWWVREKEFRKIVARYWKGEFGLGTVAREALDVMPSWSFMDVGIRARVVAPIKAYASAGSTQYRDQLPNGWTVTMGGWPDVEQLYIPGLRGEAFAALRVEEQDLVSTDGFGF